MTILDAPMGRVAKTLIQKFGRPATISKVASSDYDPSTGKAATPEDSSISCSVVFEEFSASEIDGTLVQEGDRKGLVARLEIDYEPKPNRDTLTEGGRTWKIVRTLGYSSGAEEAAYSLHLRP